MKLRFQGIAAHASSFNTRLMNAEIDVGDSRIPLKNNKFEMSKQVQHDVTPNICHKS